MASSVSITPYMMMPGDAKVVAQRLYETLANPPKFKAAPLPEGEPASVDGQWELTMFYARGSAIHTVIFEQKGASLTGTHHGEYVAGDLRGSVAANLIRFRSSQKIGGTRLSFDFTGTVESGKMAGDVNLGEYGAARWTGQRHHYQGPKGAIRPVKTA